MSSLLAAGLVLVVSGIGAMPHIWSAHWWVVIIGIVVISNALTALTKKGKKS